MVIVVAAALANCCVGAGSEAVDMGPVASCFYDGGDGDVGRYRRWLCGW